MKNKILRILIFKHFTPVVPDTSTYTYRRDDVYVTVSYNDQFFMLFSATKNGLIQGETYFSDEGEFDLKLSEALLNYEIRKIKGWLCRNHFHLNDTFNESVVFCRKSDNLYIIVTFDKRTYCVFYFNENTSKHEPCEQNKSYKNYYEFMQQIKEGGYI